MPAAKDSGIVHTSKKELPVLAVNVLERLGYHVSRSSKQLDQILANERLDEFDGRDTWRQEYRVALTWRKTTDGSGVLVNVEIEERKGGSTDRDCQKRADAILIELQKAANRAREVSADADENVTHGAAKWGTERELREAGYFQKKPDPRRLIIGRTQTGEYLQVPELHTYSHAIVCGRTGVGKSTGFFIPNLIERTGSNMIVTEATPGEEASDLFIRTAGWRAMAGNNIYSFNLALTKSHRINPIDRVRNAPQGLKLKRAERLADLIILNGQKEEARMDPMWDKSEKLLLVPLILHSAAADPQNGHLGAIRWLLLSGIKNMLQVMKSSPSPIAKMEFEGWLNLTGENFRFGVMSGLLTKFNPWMTDQIVALTETTSFDLDALKDQLFTFYLAVPNNSSDAKLVGSLIFNFLFDHVLEMQEKGMKWPTALLLDEFTNFGKIAGIADTLALVRKRKLALVLGFQNYAQLERVYSRKESEIILDQPQTQVYFRQKNYREAKQLSDALGRTTVEETVVTDSGRVQDFVMGRALASPEELINLKKEAIVFTPDTWPLKLPLTAPDSYDHACKYPPPEIEEFEISEFIQKRGATAKVQQAKFEQQTAGKVSNEARKRSRNDGPNLKKEKDEDKKTRQLDDEIDPPDLGDVWQL
jgi:type IV secretory pathway TraG/TraD family ATPase VirD4